MTWQDELKKLDDELASGRISADDYRRRRDEVLAGSAGGGQAQQQPQQAAFARPFKWEAKPPTSQSPDATQVVHNQPQPGQQPQPPQQQNPNPDATQVVNTQRQSADAERTQFVTPVSPQGPWGQQGPQQQAPAPPPWVSGDYDQFNQQPASWSHGPEVFDEAGGKGKGRIFAIIGVVLVLALIGGGVWWFVGRDSGSSTANTTTQSTSQTPTTTTKPKDSLSIMDLPGAVEDHKNIQAFSDAEKSNFLAPDEIKHYNTAGAGKARLSAAANNGVHVLIFTTEAGSKAQADTGRDELAQQEIIYGLAAIPSAPVGVQASQVDKSGDKPALIRAHYSSKNTIVRIQVVSTDSLQKASDVFSRIVAEQLRILEANG
ncbi:SHOCT domain-containing protein [Lentzea cavernae]|uniref:SHOCT domain-containing protein n=1 Tax=Lentzea cavernae TaxID=2020703 RepID=UPI00174AEA57|nr:SHOCT domain-containing protein [Lentzea cavernae]